MVFLRTAGLRQAKPQLNLNWEVTFGPRDVPLRAETHLSMRSRANPVHFWIIHEQFSILRRRSGVKFYIELLICWTCCGVKAKAKHVSWNRWLLSDAAERQRERKRERTCLIAEDITYKAELIVPAFSHYMYLLFNCGKCWPVIIRNPQTLI